MGLGERLNGIQEVSGSIPLISTTRGESRGFHLKPTAFSAFCLFETGGQEAFPAPCDVFDGKRMCAAGNLNCPGQN